MRSPEASSSHEDNFANQILPTRPIARLADPEPMSAADIGSEILAAECEPYWDRPEDFTARLESNEVANLAARYIDIFDLSEVEKQNLIDLIKRNDGLVRLFVHPYYALDEIHCQEIIDDQRRIDGMIQKILVQGKENRPPVIIMEGYNSIEELYNYLKGFNEDDVYIAPTYFGTSQPYPNAGSLKTSSDKVEDCPNWQQFIELLQGLGVQRILIGGQYLSVLGMQHVRRDAIRYGRCLGHAINNLRSEFEIKLSNASTITRKEFTDNHKYYSNQSGVEFRDSI